jgi:hypothetical protein
LNIRKALAPTPKSCVPVATLCLFLALTGCERRGKVERGILREIHHSCAIKNSCTIRIKDFAAFDWDRMYFFTGQGTSQDRSDALGTREEGYREFEEQLVFLKNGRIVYQESEPTNIEKRVRNDVVFQSLGNQNFIFFEPKAVFSVSVEEGSDRPWYLLNEIR